MNKLAIFKEFWQYLVEDKNWWILPIVFTLLCFGALIVLTQGSALAPLIYTLF